ncbi:MAG: bifunctional pyr operon transcriptional regulator/uracil phosphoribosyltransferase PyrR [Thermoanaerobaculales bacterium]|jgi:pyrimidine operon attenuation protein/uracil phosphoribosyltransferase|nr:bifunctional pyr operon transcriptional regulator/uracil phosphoribosyltransferase PyrR [Thermoanaerobaculales bacterium]
MAHDQKRPASVLQIMDAKAVQRTVVRMAAQIVERDSDGVMLVGIHTRGVPLADRIAAELASTTGTPPVVGRLDITLYRDDIGPWRPAHTQPVLRKTVLPVSIDGKVIYLVDDVLYTGRTVRAALDTLIDYGRPRAIRLAVLVDRGHRELPVAADVVGKVVVTTRREDVQVRLRPADDEDGVWLGREAPDGS